MWLVSFVITLFPGASLLSFTVHRYMGYRAHTAGLLSSELLSLFYNPEEVNTTFLFFTYLFHVLSFVNSLLQYEPVQPPSHAKEDNSNNRVVYGLVGGLVGFMLYLVSSFNFTQGSSQLEESSIMFFVGEV